MARTTESSKNDGKKEAGQVEGRQGQVEERQGQEGYTRDIPQGHYTPVYTLSLHHPGYTSPDHASGVHDVSAAVCVSGSVSLRTLLGSVFQPESGY